MNFNKILQLKSAIAVLIIEDSIPDCVTYTRYLQSDPDYSYEIFRAIELQTGIALWQTQQPDIVLLDINLPDGSGLEFLEFLQTSYVNSQLNSKLPVIVLSGGRDERVVVQAMQLGAMDYLVKDDLTAVSLRKSILSVVEYQALVSQLTRAQQQKELLSEVALRIRQSLDLHHVLQSAVDGLRQLLNCDRAIIYQFQPNWSGQVVVESVCTPEFSILNQEIFDPCLSTQWHEPYRLGRTSYFNDREHSSIRACHAELLDSLNVRANLVTSILQDNQLWGLLIAHECVQPRDWQALDINLIQQLATQVSIAIQQATAHSQLQTELRERQRAEAQLQQFNEALEHLVTQRTSDLQQSEARLQEAQQIARMGHWEFEVATAKITWSPEIFRIFGYHPDQVEPDYETNLQLFAEVDRDRIEAAIQGAIQTGESYELDIPFTRTDGFPGHLFVRGKPVANQQGEVVRLVGILMDISERYQIQTQLRSLSDRLTLALEVGKIGTWDWDLVNEASWDERMYVLYGLEHLERPATYQDWASSLHPDDRETAEWTFEQSLAQGKLDMEFRILLPNGTIRFIKAMGVMHHDKQGQPQRMIGINYDITERKEAETALVNYTQEIEDLYNNAPCGYHSLDLEGRFIQVNETELKWLGYTRTEMIGKPLSDFLTAESRQEFFTNYERFLEQGWVKNLEYKMVCKDGSILPVLVSATAVKNEDGTHSHNRATLLDISDLKEFEHQLQQTNAELMRATRLKDEFLANMSHELRTPLNAILGLSEALQEEFLGPLNEQQLKAISTVENSGRYLLELINDVLDLSKIASGKMELFLAPTSVQLLCESSLLFIRQQAFNKEIHVTHDLPANIGDITVDERRIKQALINLLTNAVKFTPEGGQISLNVEIVATGIDPQWQGQITTCTQSKGQEMPFILFQVLDTGIGIETDDLPRLFQPFMQIDSSLNRQQTGTGLGLAMVKQIIELHGGQVMVESCLGQGSCFTIALPYQDPFAVELLALPGPATIDISSSIDSAKTAHTPLILLAEDNEANIATFTTYLTARNYRLIVANNGEDAIALAKSAQPDIVLMDIQMPDMDGLEAIRLMRRDDQLATMPIIALTALAMPGDQERCLAAGASQYLSKPVSLKQLVELIQLTLGRHH